MKRVIISLVLASSISSALADSYVQPLNCTATGIALNNPSNTATVQCPNTPPPPQGCLAPPIITSTTPGIANFTRATGSVTVNYFSLGNHSVDITNYDSIFGQLPSPTTWPGNSGITAVIPLKINNYVSAQFTVPAGYMASAPANRYGVWYVNASAYGRAPISATVSTRCGDFSDPFSSPASTVVSGCYRNKARADMPAVSWESPKHVSPSCVLHDGQTYYLNIINADISTLTPTGGSAASTSKSLGSTCAASCADPIANYIFN